MIKLQWYSRATPSERLCIKICGLKFRGKMRKELRKMVSEGLEFSCSTYWIGSCTLIWVLFDVELLGGLSCILAGYNNNTSISVSDCIGNLKNLS